MATAPLPAAIGFTVHTGWAAAVVVGGTAHEPVVLERARLQLFDAEDGSPPNVFHAVEQRPSQEAEPIVGKATEAAHKRARAEIGRLVDAIRGQDHEVRAAGFALPGGALPKAVAEIVKSHAFMHSAEGALFREALIVACDARGLRVTRVLRKKLYPSGAIEFGRPEVELKKAISEAGKGLGPPWGADQKEAMLLGWMALAMSAPSPEMGLRR